MNVTQRMALQRHWSFHGFSLIILGVILCYTAMKLFRESSDLVPAVLQLIKTSGAFKQESNMLRDHLKSRAKTVCNVIDYSNMPPADFTCYHLNTTPSPEVM